MCDLSKAFDCVNINLLLLKLEYYGIRGTILQLLSSYLRGREQYVCYNSKESGLLPMEHGVPQGSVLGPVLFLLYINDMPLGLDKGECILFADDAVLINKDLPPMSEDCFNKANVFCMVSANYLHLNDDKTQLIHLTSDKWAIKSEPVRYLGITLDSILNWGPHVDGLCSRLATEIFVLRQLKCCLDDVTLKCVYYANIHSHLAYGCLLWGNSVKSHKVFSLQKVAVRLLVGEKYGSHCNTIFNKLGILPLPCIYILAMAKQIHQNINNFSKHSDTLIWYPICRQSCATVF